ncbi:MAG TPA: NifB/NifX family molybdenum-iron cluster-binding protein [Spirochaetota bacterium]|nr:NifB/NifX family molybdenum-iron cluster-binding protein [Spirochaetota bacterium]HNT13189.1 NifB/NifX family molybdenum-iron cluster-binding protein [Spirochaetota bacterium]HNV46690.1 NifB/NifX family molybdenum-iron cluster-binding protein [Spirochaetota bacterium]HOS39062.1 NifB/NifX family molybdenum-iron cluster-binding protein [Spirochaetota bacterium]HPI22213.1 NifB/NifX family molybdenum-iron cluster-binding protein [Spirochaetota bacterium]
MKIAMPVSNGKLCMHFGHCEQFDVYNVDDATKLVSVLERLDAPPHEPGLLPRWLAGKGVTCVIAGGMGSRAQSLFKEQGVAVVTGAPAGDPEEILAAYLSGRLVTGANACDH